VWNAFSLERNERAPRGFMSDQYGIVAGKGCSAACFTGRSLPDIFPTDPFVV
jgi:hypothetical protein